MLMGCASCESEEERCPLHGHLKCDACGKEATSFHLHLDGSRWCKKCERNRNKAFRKLEREVNKLYHAPESNDMFKSYLSLL